MGNRQSWALRALRALVFAALTLALSAGAHLLVNGQTPLPGRAMLLSGAGVFAFALAATAAERGYWQIAGALVPLELALNSAWNVGQADCFSPAAHAGNVPTLLLCGNGGLGGTSTHHLAAATGGLTTAQALLLLGAHVLAGLVVALWLRRGEAVVHRLLRTLALAPLRMALRLLALVPAESAAPAAAPLPSPDAGTLPAVLLARAVSRRGPPEPAFA